MKKSYTILMVDDEKDLYDLTKLYFDRENFILDYACNAQEAIQYLYDKKPDLVLLDVGLPDLCGFDVLKKIQEFSEVPVIFLTSMSKVQDQLRGLRSGAEDYFLKPFHPQLLLEKVKLFLKRQEVKKPEVRSSKSKFKELVIDYENQTMEIRGEMVPLTHTEFQILSILTNNPGRYFTSEAIYEKIWFANSMGDTRGVLVHISNLRKKLMKADSDKSYIMTKRNYGYKFNEYLCES